MTFLSYCVIIIQKEDPMIRMIKYLLIFMAVAFIMPSHAFEISGKGQIYYVIDGDTVLMSGVQNDVYRFLKNQSHDKDNFNDRYNSIKIRIGNINTKESKHRDKSRNSKAGEEAGNYLKNLVEKKYFNFYCWDIGDHGRPICSVFNEQIDIGEHMIKRGYTDYVTYWGKHPKWHKRYSEAQKYR